MIITNGFFAGVLSTLFVEMTMFVAFVLIGAHKQNVREEQLKEEFRNNLRKALNAKENSNED